MPAFIDTPEKEKDWQRAKKIVKEEYNLTEKSDQFWKLTNGIYQKMNKKASARQAELVAKLFCIGLVAKSHI